MKYKQALFLLNVVTTVALPIDLASGPPPSQPDFVTSGSSEVRPAIDYWAPREIYPSVQTTRVPHVTESDYFPTPKQAAKEFATTMLWAGAITGGVVACGHTLYKLSQDKKARAHLVQTRNDAIDGVNDMVDGLESIERGLNEHFINEHDGLSKAEAVDLFKKVQNLRMSGQQKQIDLPKTEPKKGLCPIL